MISALKALFEKPAKDSEELQQHRLRLVADGKLGKYEEHLVRQVADLIYVPHQDYIRSKLAAKES